MRFSEEINCESCCELFIKNIYNDSTLCHSCLTLMSTRAKREWLEKRASLPLIERLALIEEIVYDNYYTNT